MKLKITTIIALGVIAITSCSNPQASASKVEVSQNKISETPKESTPVTIEDLLLLKKTLLWTEEDDKYLKMAGDVLEPQLDDVLDVWYGYVGGNEHLVYYFNSHGKPSGDYLGKVRVRFKQWVLDLCNRKYDQEWLNYQNEIGLRHTTKKGQTDKVENTPNIVNYRYMMAFIYPITVTIKPFLEKGNKTPEEIEKMHNAWFKAVVLSDILWTKPYIKENHF